MLLLGALAAFTYWLDAQVQPPPPRRDGSERHDPDIFVEGFKRDHARRGRAPAQSIAGKARARTSATTRPPSSRSPMLAQTEAGKPAFRVTADRGKLSGDRKDVYLHPGNVRAVREAGPVGARRGTGRAR